MIKFALMFVLISIYGCNASGEGSLTIITDSGKESTINNPSTSNDNTNNSSNGDQNDINANNGNSINSNNNSEGHLNSIPQVAIPEVYENIGQLNVLQSDNGKALESSYNAISLPGSAELSNGWEITIKATNGPIYIYPTDGILIDDHRFIILTDAGSVIKITFDTNKFTTQKLTGNISYNLFKDDAPLTCPDGMFPVAGSYLLETTGFCVSQGYQSASSAIPQNIYDNETKCKAIAGTAGSGSSDVLSFNEYQTILAHSLNYRASEDGILDSTELTAFHNQFPKYRSVSRSSKTCEVHIKCYQYQTDGKLYIDANNYISLRTSCSRKQLYKFVYGSKRANGCSYFQIESLELFKTGNNGNTLTPSTCGNIESASSDMNLNIFSDGTNTAPSNFPQTSNFSVSEKNPQCDFSNFNFLNPIHTSGAGLNFFPDVSTIFTSSQVNSYAVIHKTQIAKKFEFVNASANQGTVYYHCSYRAQ